MSIFVIFGGERRQVLAVQPMRYQRDDGRFAVESFATIALPNGTIYTVHAEGLELTS